MNNIKTKIIIFLKDRSSFMMFVKGAMLIVAIVSGMYYSTLPSNSDIDSVTSQINGVDFKQFNKFIDNSEHNKSKNGLEIFGSRIQLNNGVSVFIKKSATNPTNELIVSRRFLWGEPIYFEVKNIDGLAKVVSITDEDGKELRE